MIVDRGSHSSFEGKSDLNNGNPQLHALGFPHRGKRRRKSVGRHGSSSGSIYKSKLGYTLENQHNYGTWPFIVDFSLEDGDFRDRNCSNIGVTFMLGCGSPSVSAGTGPWLENLLEMTGFHIGKSPINLWSMAGRARHV